ncbi:hypothetical protein HDU79_000239 [Rhizoclosmatium sp. JEL0117]|nr:hypothetical protein HDU79_000239 [Rhizoclosmatium sp. JEL0117]
MQHALALVLLLIPYLALARELKKRATLKVSYFSGPIIQQVQVFPVYYGQVTNQPLLDQFYQFVVKSSVMDVLGKEYSWPPTNQFISHGSWIGSYIDANVSSATALDDRTNVQPYLKGLIAQGQINVTLNTYIPVHFAPAIKITHLKTTTCVDVCGYHDTLDIRDLGIPGVSYVAYGIIPDLSTDACAQGCGSASEFENTCVTATHELTEAVTNPLFGLATGGRWPLAWYSTHGAVGEIGDICQNVVTTLKDEWRNTTWMVQTVWSNSEQKCTAS